MEYSVDKSHLWPQNNQKNLWCSEIEMNKGQLFFSWAMHVTIFFSSAQTVY